MMSENNEPLLFDEKELEVGTDEVKKPIYDYESLREKQIAKRGKMGFKEEKRNETTRL